MTSQHDKPKRWRPRFSVRTLAIVVRLVCVYFGAWEATKRHAISVRKEEIGSVFEGDWERRVVAMQDAQAIYPCILIHDEGKWLAPHPNIRAWEIERRWQIWLFGLTIDLPYVAISNEYPRGSNAKLFTPMERK